MEESEGEERASAVGPQPEAFACRPGDRHDRCVQTESQAGALGFAQQFNKNRWIYAQNKTQMNKQIVLTMETEDPIFIDNISKLLWKNLQKK